MHNLFGDTDSVNVSIHSDGSYELSKATRGDTVDSVLRYVHIDTKELSALYKAKLDETVEDEKERSAMLEELEAGLHGYTYLEDE
jgi:arginine decarboxylase